MSRTATSSPGHPAAAQFAATVIAQDRIFRGLRRVLPAVVEAGVLPMPLKGILLAWALYDRPERRPISDADVLVRVDDLARAVAVLAREGGRVVVGTGLKRVLRFEEPDGAWKLDLHAELWRGFVPIDLDDAWRRAGRWASPFGVEMAEPPREFTFTHGAAHFARNGHTRSRSDASAEIAKLARWAVEGLGGAAPLVSYVDRSGASAAVYYALSAAAWTGDPVVDELRRRLPVPRWRAALLDRLARGGALPHPRLLRPLLV